MTHQDLAVTLTVAAVLAALLVYGAYAWRSAGREEARRRQAARDARARRVAALTSLHEGAWREFVDAHRQPAPGPGEGR